MKLSQKQFKKLLEQNKLFLSFIGMSNIGKTHWSKKLVRLNFKHFNSDSLVEKRLAPLLKLRGYSGIKDVSRWMGQPYHKRFYVNQQKYLDSERLVMESIFTRLKKVKRHNVIVDTTGSIAHLGTGVFSKLKKHTLIIYISASNSMKEAMFKRYIKSPKPVVFGKVYAPHKGESEKAALKRCYLKLLRKRGKIYSKYADIVLPYESTSKITSGEELISLISEEL